MQKTQTCITLQKMQTHLNSDNQAQYELQIDNQVIDKSNIKSIINLNKLINTQISLEFTGKITCQGCNKIIKKC